MAIIKSELLFAFVQYLTFFSEEVCMKRALYLLSAVALGAAVFTGCGLVDPVDKDTADLVLTNDTVTVSAGQSVAINGSVDASVVPTIVFAPSNLTYITVPGTVITPTEKKFKLSDIDLKISAAANTPSGTYYVEISILAGTVTTTKNQYVTVTGGTSGDTLAIAHSDTIWHIASEGRGSYDLVNGVTVAAASASTTKDIADASLAADAMGLVLVSKNGATFKAAAAADYDGATAAEVKTLALAATAENTGALSTGSIFVVKLGASRGYAIVKVLLADTTDASKTSGANTGKIVFQYKFTAN
jgi:hypothetical protein